MKKTLISVFAFTTLVTVSLVSLKFRLKPPKKEVFNFDEPLKEEEQEVLDEYKQSIEIQENKQLKYDTKNKIEEIQRQVELLNDLQKKFPLNPDQFEKRIMDSYDASLRNALDYAISAIDTTQLFIDRPLKKMTLNRPSTVLYSISGNVKEISSHLSIYDSSYPLKKQYCIENIISELNCSLAFLQRAEAKGMLLTSSYQFDFNDKGLQSSEKNDENITIIGNTVGVQQEFLHPNILVNNSLEQLYAYQYFSHSLGDVILSNQLKIEDVPQELRLLGGSQLYQKAWLYSRKHSDVEQYILTFRLLLNDIKSFKGNSTWTRKEAIKLILDELINGSDFFNENKVLIDFIIEQKETLESFGILYDPDYSSVFSKEKISTDEKDELKFCPKNVVASVSSAKEEEKILSYIARQIRRFQIRGIGFAIIVNSKYFKRPRKAYEYLVEHADEWRESPEVSDVVISDISVKIYFKRK
ncbi:hypothetical protein BW152_12075 [Lactococcus lactis]|uniref:hypothetical protein n=1 Tax=Lactococcus lactis TaxID=1358 RepID=UPI000BF68CB6|nr:hypothetical protein [Lactococcus lactis]PFG79180.1 hypothetical protein BW152_12075 [Lactococcus lactis]